MKAKLISLPIEKRLVLQLCLISLIAWVIPHSSATLAAEQEKAQIFEIQNPNLINTSIDFHTLVENDPLSKNLQEYLEEHDSPLAEYATEIVKQPQWQRALAISWVESNFGRFCADNNCSGIGVAPGHPAWRKYPNKLEWFKDMTKLMETPRYKEKYTTFEKMRGIYVYPGSDNWVRGAKQKYAELMALEKNSEEQKTLATINLNKDLALAK